MRRSKVGMIAGIVTSGAVACSLLAAGPAAAYVPPNDSTTMSYLIDHRDNQVLTVKSELEIMKNVGVSPSDISALLSGVSSLSALFKSCEASTSSFPECLIDGGPSLSDIQKEVQQLSAQIAAFQQEFERDYSQLQTSIAQISAQIYKQATQSIVTQTQTARNGASGALKNYNAFAQCQLKFYSSSTDQCTYYDSGGYSTLSGPADQKTLDAIRSNIFTSLDMNPTSNDQDQVRGDSRMLEPATFMQLMGGQYTNPWSCASSANAAANLFKACGLMGYYFADQAATERADLGVGTDGKITIFRPGFVNDMNAASEQMQSMLTNYLVVRYAAAQLMAATLDPTSQQGKWIADLSSELKGLAANGSSDPTNIVLTPSQVATTFSGPDTPLPGGDQVGYTLNNNWSFFAGDTTNALLIESYGGNQGTPSTTPGIANGQLPTEKQASTVAEDMVAVGQKWSNAAAATKIPGVDAIYPAAAGDGGTNPATAGRLWTQAQTVSETVINSEWADVWGTYFWNLRLNTPGYNNQADSGTSIPQAYVKLYTMQPNLGITSQTKQVQRNLLFNVFDSLQSPLDAQAKIQICEDAASPACEMTSTKWTAAGHRYEDLWLASTCQYRDYGDYHEYDCNPDRQVVGTDNIVVAPGVQGIPPAVNWKVQPIATGGIVRLPKDQTAVAQ